MALDINLVNILFICYSAQLDYDSCKFLQILDVIIVKIFFVKGYQFQHVNFK